MEIILIYESNLSIKNKYQNMRIFKDLTNLNMIFRKKINL